MPFSPSDEQNVLLVEGVADLTSNQAPSHDLFLSTEEVLTLFDLLSGDPQSVITHI